MKIQIEDYLYTLDQSLGQKSDRDKNMVFVMIFTLLFAFSYLLFWESAEISFQESHEKAQKVENELTIDKDYLAANPPERIAQIEQETLQLRQTQIKYTEYNSYIKEQLSQISSLYYDERVWGAYLDSISRYAKTYGVKLTTFRNTLQADNNSFGHIMDIQIVSEGPYKNTMKFINALEQSQLVVDLHDFNLTADEKLTGELNISVWGIVRQ